MTTPYEPEIVTDAREIVARQALRPYVEGTGRTIRTFRALVWAEGIYGDRCEALAQELYAEHTALRKARFEAAGR